MLDPIRVPCLFHDAVREACETTPREQQAVTDACVRAGIVHRASWDGKGGAVTGTWHNVEEVLADLRVDGAPLSQRKQDLMLHALAVFFSIAPGLTRAHYDRRILPAKIGSRTVELEKPLRGRPAAYKASWVAADPRLSSYKQRLDDANAVWEDA